MPEITRHDESEHEPHDVEFAIDADRSTLLSRDDEGVEGDNRTSSHERMKLIYRLGLNVCDQQRAEDVFDHVTGALPKLIPLERYFIATLDGEGQLRPRASLGFDPASTLQDFPVSNTMMSRALSEGLAILTSNAMEDTRFSDLPSVKEHQIRSVMCVPLGRKGSCIGLIYADNRLSKGTFSRHDLVYFTALCHFIHLSIRNAEALDDANSARRQSDARWLEAQRAMLHEQDIIGGSRKLIDAFDLLRRAADSVAPLLLLGEMGTGKELFARAAHQMSPRAAGPFVVVNCGALPSTLVESELFGVKKGAFSGADQDRQGRFELADGGTLFLDEVAEFSLDVQSKLLRVLEYGQFDYVGGTQTAKVDVRLVCATNKDLSAEVRAGRFREDLLYRINAVEVKIPPLRERLDDVPQLASHLLRKIGSARTLEPAALTRLQSHAWPGNIRELGHVIERLHLFSERDVICADDVKRWLKGSATVSDQEPTPQQPLREVIQRTERDHMRRVLEHTSGHHERAREILGIAKSTYWKKVNDYGLKGEQAQDEDG